MGGKVKDRDEVVEPTDDQDLAAMEQAELDAEQQEAADTSLALAARVEEEREASVPVLSTLPTVGEWDAMNALAARVAATQFVPGDLRGKPDAVLACILAGREMGIGPMQSLRQIHIIDGRPAFAADLMLAMMRSSGIVILESGTDSERAWIKARRSDTGEVAEVEWTMAEAAEAKLVGKKNWQQYPSDMLWARCVGRLARRLGSDMFGGMNYTAEEVRDFDDGGYGDSGYGSDAGGSAYFDPARDLLPEAPKGWKAIASLLDQIEPTVEWQALVSELLNLEFEVLSVKDLTDEQSKPFGHRLANFARKLSDTYGTAFPPPSAEQIMAELEWAFELTEGHGIVITFKARTEPAATDDGEGTTAEPGPEAGHEPVEGEVFDPAAMLLPGAPSGSYTAIKDGLDAVDDSVNWMPMIQASISHVYGGKTTVSSLGAEEKRGAARRLANVVARLTEFKQVQEWVSNEQIVEAFAEMFMGVVVDVPESES